jgi:Amt family ammonium transporter
MNLDRGARREPVIERDRLELDCQPIVRDTTSRPERFELLVRQRSVDGVRCMPSTFLPQADKAGLLPELDRWVVGQAVDWLSARSAYGLPTYTLNINLSAPTIADGNFASDLHKLLSEVGIEGKYLCFEVTESASIRDLEQAAHVLEELRNEGATIALDDFGTGHSSFNRLSSLPVDFLKIDGVFVKGMAHRKVDKTIVRTIIELGHSLDIAVVAEYVEDEEVAASLKSLGVDLLQGYALGRPTSFAELN